MTDEYEEQGCEFLGPEQCDEALDEKGIDIGEAERKHYGQYDEE